LVLAYFFATAQEPKPTLVYVFDPNCGWCYSFNHEIEKLHDKFKQRVQFTVVSGGMIVGSHVRPMSEMSENILASYQTMQKTTGVKFGEPYLEMVKEGKELVDSERPSKAVVAFREMNNEKIFEFVHELQKAHFYQGRSYNGDDLYMELAKNYGLNGLEFIQKMNSDSVKTLVKEDFKKVEETGIEGFPVVLLMMNDKVYLVSEGYQKHHQLERKINRRLKGY